MPQGSLAGGLPTVVAQATPPGISALAIIRLTGSETLDILSRITHLYTSPSPRDRGCARMPSSA